MKLGAFVLGYHGCDRKIGESLISGKTDFKASQNDHDWLGAGIYFWENNPKRAMQWAQFMSRHPKFNKRVRDPFVAGSVIELGNCLDLTEAASLSLVQAAHTHLVEVFNKADTSLPKNKQAFDGDADLVQRFLDCAVVNHLHCLRMEESLNPFTTVRGVFTEGGELYAGSRFLAKTHIQLCVRNTASIRGVFLPREGFHA